MMSLSRLLRSQMCLVGILKKKKLERFLRTADKRTCVEYNLTLDTLNVAGRILMPLALFLLLELGKCNTNLCCSLCSRKLVFYLRVCVNRGQRLASLKRCQYA